MTTLVNPLVLAIDHFSSPPVKVPLAVRVAFGRPAGPGPLCQGCSPLAGTLKYSQQSRAAAAS